VSLVLLLGGARSGKSRNALRLVAESGLAVAFVATAEARDEEMAERIARHRSERPPAWLTIEEPLRLGEALERVPATSALVVDCLSLWVANLLEQGAEEDEIVREAAVVAAETAAREPLSVAVSNEVGLGVVPATVLGRRYRDCLGRVNAAWADAAGEVFLVVAGRLLRLESADA
jgi:adenosyl cobinamide kinase/adenosyl cobinamide phosphate guanylyltransferase